MEKLQQESHLIPISSRTSVAGSPKRILKFLYIPFAVCAALIMILSGVSVIVYASYSQGTGPFFVTNQYQGIWLCALLFFFSSNLLYHTVKPNQKIKHVGAIINIIYFATLSICSAILFITFCMSGIRSDEIIWSILILITNVLNLTVVILRMFNPLYNFETKNTARKVGCCFYIVLIVLVSLIKGLALIFLVLLTNGSTSIASGFVKYPARGTFVNVPLNDGSGRSHKIHFKCEGPKNESAPVFMFEGDFSHGYADYLWLQDRMTASGRRSCIWDKPGLGYSSFLYSDEKGSSLFYHNFITSIGEKGPFIFVGWGGGGSIVYQYALDHPEMVKSLVFLDVFPDMIEFTSQFATRNLTQTQYKQMIRLDMMGRKALISIINGLAIPWGLMSVLAPINPLNMNPYKTELNFFMTTEMTWGTQQLFLNQIYDNAVMDPMKIDNVFSRALPSSIPVYPIITKHDTDWVVRTQCNNVRTTQTCEEKIKQLEYMWNEQSNMVANLNGGRITYCTNDGCGQGYYIFDNAEYTANTLNSLFPL